MYDCIDVSAAEIREYESCAESREVLPEAGKDYKGSEMEVLETVRAAPKFDRSQIQKLKI
jgi:hypothetical protein